MYFNRFFKLIGCYLGTQDILVNKTNTNPCLFEANILVGERNNKHFV